MFGENIKRGCARAGITYAELAERVGVTKAMVSKWVAGAKPREVTLIKLAKVLGTTPQELLEGDIPMPVDAFPNRKKGSELPPVTESASEYLEKTIRTMLKMNEDKRRQMYEYAVFLYNK